jgi:hypothetical protein
MRAQSDASSNSNSSFHYAVTTYDLFVIYDLFVTYDLFVIYDLFVTYDLLVTYDLFYHTALCAEVL